MKKTLSLMACMAFLALALVQLGSSEAVLQGVSGNATTINHGESFEVTFSIYNNNPANDFKNITDIIINLPVLSAIQTPLSGSWTAAKYGQQPLTVVSNKISLGNIKILSKTASEPIKVTFTSQKGSKAAVYNGDITFLANFQEGEQKFIPAQVPPIVIIATVRETPQITLSAQNQLTLIQSLTNVTITNAGNTLVSNIKLNISGNLNLTISPSGDIAKLGIGESATRQVSYDAVNLKFGSRTGTVTATAEGGTTVSLSFSFAKSFCRAGEKSSNLTISNAEINSFGEDEDDWRLLDEISFEADIKNSGNQDVDDVIVVLGLFDENGNDLSNDLDFSNKDEEKYELGDIADGDTETATFDFKVPADMKLGNYKLALKAYGDEEKEENLCVDTTSDFNNKFYREIKISGESDDGKQVAFDNIRFTPTTEAECGDKMFLVLDVVNIGDTDQDQVKVTLQNSQLGIDQYIEIKNNLNKGDTEKNVRFSFDVPAGAENKIYELELGAEYGYKKSRGVYEDTLDDKVKVPLKVIGCKVQPSNVPQAEINVLPLDKEAKAGGEITVTSAVKNIGNKNNTYIVGAKGYESWATLKSATERIITLTPGETKEVKMTFTISPGAKGEQSLSVETISNGKTDTRPVKVLLAENGETKSPFAGFSLGGSTLLWVIGIINVILLVLIIILAIRLSRR